MKWLIVLTILLVSQAFIEKQQAVTVKEHLNNSGDSVTGGTIIINAFDISAMKARKNKKALFYALTDTLRYLVKSRMEKNDNRQIEIAVEPFINISPGDSIVYQLLKQNKSAYAVVIKDYDVYFEQKDVEVLKDEGGTHRNASYNIYCVINYAYYDNTHLIKESRVSVFHYFATRSVISGLFAAGPNIVSNKEAAIGITADNVSEYFRSHFPW